ncbi:hypothetical protein P7K49_018801 [Saguinus oedipus]|uniref:Ig-like domain-containing protein n=1 Tax=Saguinus oedipus TaxID=9490 RepID=A0ABQ9V6I1_SAGOE|nr:hypothetical protein P7K49_018801 [Saguinus oedipus]
MTSCTRRKKGTPGPPEQGQWAQVFLSSAWYTGSSGVAVAPPTLLPFSLGTQAPPTLLPFSLGTQAPPTLLPFSLGTQVPPTLLPFSLGTQAPPTLLPFSLGTQAPPTLLPFSLGTQAPPTLLPFSLGTQVPPTLLPFSLGTQAPPTLLPFSLGTQVPPTLLPFSLGTQVSRKGGLRARPSREPHILGPATPTACRPRVTALTRGQPCSWAWSAQSPEVFPVTSECELPKNESYVVLACLITGYKPKPVTVTWYLGTQIQPQRNFPEVEGKANSYTTSSQLFTPVLLQHQSKYKCVVRHDPSNNTTEKTFRQPAPSPNIQILLLLDPPPLHGGSLLSKGGCRAGTPPQPSSHPMLRPSLLPAWLPCPHLPVHNPAPGTHGPSALTLIRTAPRISESPKTQPPTVPTTPLGTPPQTSLQAPPQAEGSPSKASRIPANTRDTAASSKQP